MPKEPWPKNRLFAVADFTPICHHIRSISTQNGKGVDEPGHTERTHLKPASRPTLMSTHACPKCGSTFTRKDNRERHARTCDGRNIHRVTCNKCQRQFSKPFNCRRHEETCKIVPTPDAAAAAGVRAPPPAGG